MCKILKNAMQFYNKYKAIFVMIFDNLRYQIFNARRSRDACTSKLKLMHHIW